MEYYVDEGRKNTVRVFPRQGRASYGRYDANENPEGLPKEFVTEVLSEITPEFLATYPEPEKFQREYAAFLGVPPDCVLATNGSDMAIRYVMETFGERDKCVVTVAPSFEMYRVNCSVLGLCHVPVSYEPDLSIKVEKILDSITADTRIVVLLNPNNPVGNVYSEEEARKIVRRAADVGAVVVIDEAYHYFYTETFLPLVEEFDNVVLLRTFSKLFSLAACRLGTVVSNPQIIQYLKNGKLTYDVNSVALLFGERILQRTDLLERLVKTQAEGKAYVLAELTRYGYSCRDCMGNFIFVRPKHPAKEVAERLEREKKILVHDYRNELLKDYIRISTGSKEAMKRILTCFLEIDA